MRKKVDGARSKARAFSLGRKEALFTAVFELNRDKGYSIKKLCGIAGVSRAGYYKWKDRKPSESEITNAILAKQVQRIYDESKGVFGVRRIKLALKAQCDLKVNNKRIRKIMWGLGISSVIRRKSKWKKSEPVHISKNVINRDFEATAPNQKWFTDITYLTYGNGQKAYMSAVIDRYDMTIVAWEISTHMDNLLVKKTIEAAFRANPGAHPIIHSDRGSQYTSGMFKTLKNRYKFKTSMSRPGKCLDNQPIESFFGTYKAEYYHRSKFATLEDLINGTKWYMSFYMNKNYFEKHNGQTPSEFRQAAFAA